jgi:hypothetical protein
MEQFSQALAGAFAAIGLRARLFFRGFDLGAGLLGPCHQDERNSSSSVRLDCGGTAAVPIVPLQFDYAPKSPFRRRSIISHRAAEEA